MQQDGEESACPRNAVISGVYYSNRKAMAEYVKLCFNSSADIQRKATFPKNPNGQSINTRRLDQHKDGFMRRNEQQRSR
jgi:hypothetical protein